MLNNDKKFIKYIHLEKYLISQPFFVWNKIDNNSNWVDDYEIEEQSIWEIDFREDIPLEYAQVIKTGYGKVEEFFYEQIKKEAKILKKRIFVVKEKEAKKAAIETLHAIQNLEIDWIINPVFIYNDLLVKCQLYRKEEKKLSSLIHSSKTKLKNYIKAYFDFHVLKLLKIEIDEYSFFTYSKKTIYKNVPALEFDEYKYCWTQKNGPSNNSTKSIDEYCEKTIIEKLKIGKISKNAAFIYSFLEYIDKIRSARNITKFEQINNKDLTPWGENPNFLNLFPFKKNNLLQTSGNLIDKKTLLKILNEEVDKNKIINEKLSLKLIYRNENKIDYEWVKKYIDQIDNKNCIWYDFEAFSLPYVIIPYTKPYQHLVFQVSVIKTMNNKIVETTNIVIDPKKIKVTDFKKIIDVIFDSNYQKYIVYNKSYEITRLKEIRLLFNYLLDEEEVKIYDHKIDHIIDNTFDLNDFFKIKKSNTHIPPIFLYELNGYSSIKKIENLISNKKINLPIMIIPYKNLDVQNGLMAMNIAIQRCLNSIGDNEWNKKKKELAKYCENDVKAMIMVFYFIQYLLDSN